MASFTNMATLSYNGSQINSNVVTGELQDALTITKTAVSGGYRPGDTVTYVVTLSNTGTAALTGLTLTIRNTGNTALTGQEGAVITDTFDPILNITGVTFNGTAWTSPEDYTYDAATGAFATVAGKLTVPEAAFTQNADGSWTVTPGQSVLTVTGTV